MGVILVPSGFQDEQKSFKMDKVNLVIKYFPTFYLNLGPAANISEL